MSFFAITNAFWKCLTPLGRLHKQGRVGLEPLKETATLLFERHLFQQRKTVIRAEDRDREQLNQRRSQ